MITIQEVINKFEAIRDLCTLYITQQVKEHQDLFKDIYWKYNYIPFEDDVDTTEPQMQVFRSLYLNDDICMVELKGGECEEIDSLTADELYYIINRIDITLTYDN